jgi:hypothetical protein
VRRLELHACGIEDLEIDIQQHRHVVIILPHAHVVPDMVLSSIQLRLALGAAPPSISLVQLPCCKFIKHDQVCGTSPNVEFVDLSIATTRRTVRVWSDISQIAVAAKAIRTGDEKCILFRQQFGNKAKFLV